MTPKSITLQDIADEAGVSKTIVSKVINGRAAGRVSEKKLSLIRNLIAKYDYVPLFSAQSLATRKTRQIAFLLSDGTSMMFENPVFARMLRGVVEICKKYSYSCQTDFHNFRDLENFILPENLRRRGVDGCILTGSLSPEVLEEISRIRIPVVVLGGEPIRDVVPVITRTSKPEYEELLSYCYKLGHRHILLSGCGENAKKQYPLLAEKFPGLKVTLCEEDTAEESEILARRILAFLPEERPTLFSGNEVLCCGVLNYLRKEGVCCPGQISCVASSGCTLADLYHPRLTTYSADFLEYGIQGAELLIEMIRENLSLPEAVAKAKSIRISSCFTERESVLNINSIRKKIMGGSVV